MKTAFAVLGSLVLFGLFVFGLSLAWAWIERRRWLKMSIGERLEEYARKQEKKP